MSIKFVQKVTKTTSNGKTYPRLSITQFLEELGLKPGDEVMVEVDIQNSKLVITKDK